MRAASDASMSAYVWVQFLIPFSADLQPSVDENRPPATPAPARILRSTVSSDVSPRVSSRQMLDNRTLRCPHSLACQLT